MPMLVGSKELLILVPHVVMRNSIVLTQFEEPLATVRIVSGIESQLIIESKSKTGMRPVYSVHSIIYQTQEDTHNVACSTVLHTWD